MNNLENNDNLQEVSNKYWVDQKEAIQALREKPFFKKLILEGFMKDYLFDLAMELINPKTISENSRNVIMEKIVGIAKLQEYFEMAEALTMTEEGHEEAQGKAEVEEKNRLIGLVQALETASKDKDFNLLINECYLQDYAVNQTSMLTNDNVIRGGHRGDILEALAGCSVLQNYMVNLPKELAYMSETEGEE